MVQFPVQVQFNGTNQPTNITPPHRRPPICQNGILGKGGVRTMNYSEYKMPPEHHTDREATRSKNHGGDGQ